MYSFKPAVCGSVAHVLLLLNNTPLYGFNTVKPFSKWSQGLSSSLIIINKVVDIFITSLFQTWVNTISFLMGKYLRVKLLLHRVSIYLIV